VFYLLAIISLSVGVLNLFPLPPLDGGHLAILVVEGAIRRDLTMAAKVWIINSGGAVLLVLIGVVCYFDIKKISWVTWITWFKHHVHISQLEWLHRLFSS